MYILIKNFQLKKLKINITNTILIYLKININKIKLIFKRNLQSDQIVNFRHYNFKINFVHLTYFYPAFYANTTSLCSKYSMQLEIFYIYKKNINIDSHLN